MAVPLMFQPLVKYAQFEGRSRRSEFWLWMLFRFLLKRALGIVALMIMGPGMFDVLSHADTLKTNPEVFFHSWFASWFTLMPLFSLAGLALLLPTLAVTVRRLHDINRTGWWVVMPYVVLIVGVIIWMCVGGASLIGMIASHPHDEVSDAEGMKFAFSMVGGFLACVALPQLIAWIVMLVFFVTEGKRAPNRFGPDPKGEALNDTP